MSARLNHGFIGRISRAPLPIKILFDIFITLLAVGTGFETASIFVKNPLTILWIGLAIYGVALVIFVIATVLMVIIDAKRFPKNKNNNYEYIEEDNFNDPFAN